MWLFLQCPLMKEDYTYLLHGKHDELWSEIVEKGSLVQSGLDTTIPAPTPPAPHTLPACPPTWPHRNRPQAWITSLIKDKGPLQPVLNLWPSVGLSFPVSDVRCTPLLCLNVCVNQHPADSTISVSCLEVMRFFCCSTRGMCAEELPCISRQEGLADRGGPMPTTEADLALSLYVSQTASSSSWLCCVFLGDFDTRSQWAEALGLYNRQ